MTSTDASISGIYNSPMNSNILGNTSMNDKKGFNFNTLNFFNTHNSHNKSDSMAIKDLNSNDNHDEELTDK